MTQTAVVHVREQRDITVDVTQTEPRRRPGALGEYLPQTLILGFRRENDGDWTCATPELRGPFLRKDGSASDATMVREWLLEIPGWVVEAIESVRPDLPTR
jgi:hypothetical protein